MAKGNYTLIVPGWYPTPQKPLNGIFIKKHASLIAGFTKTVALYCTESPADAPERFTINTQTDGALTEVTVYYRPTTVKPLNQLLQLWGQLKGFAYVKTAYGLPDRIHNHVVFPAGYIALLLSVMYGLPLLITEHWSGYSAADGRFVRLGALHRFLIRKAFGKARAVSFVSQFLQTEVQSHRLINPPTTLYLTPNVLQAPVALPGKKGFNALAPRALSIGNLNDHEKNITGLLQAAALVAAQVPGFVLTIVGAGPQQQQFESLALQLGILNKNVVFAGYVPNHLLGNCYNEADFFILNSYFETFNIAAAEAMLHGLPVVSTRCGGPEEYVTVENGILVPPGNAPELATGILSMIENYHRFVPAEIAGRIKSRYGNQTIIEAFKQMYHQS